MKENVHILEFQKKISEIKCNIKMQESKCFDSFLIRINMLISEHLVYKNNNDVMVNAQMVMESKDNL